MRDPAAEQWGESAAQFGSAAARVLMGFLSRKFLRALFQTPRCLLPHPHLWSIREIGYGDSRYRLGKQACRHEAEDTSQK
jgi:hypothetical protein